MPVGAIVGIIKEKPQTEYVEGSLGTGTILRNIEYVQDTVALTIRQNDFDVFLSILMLTYCALSRTRGFIFMLCLAVLIVWGGGSCIRLNML